MAFGHYIREALVPASAGEKREKPFTFNQRFLTLLRAEQLLAGGQDQKRLKVCLRIRRNSEAPFSLLVAVRLSEARARRAKALNG